MDAGASSPWWAHTHLARRPHHRGGCRLQITQVRNLLLESLKSRKFARLQAKDGAVGRMLLPPLLLRLMLVPMHLAQHHVLVRRRHLGGCPLWRARSKTRKREKTERSNAGSL